MRQRSGRLVRQAELLAAEFFLTAITAKWGELRMCEIKCEALPGSKCGPLQIIQLNPGARVWTMRAERYYLAATLQQPALVLIDEGKARRVAKSLGLTVIESIAILERGAQLTKVPDLRSVYLGLLDQGIRFRPDLSNVQPDRESIVNWLNVLILLVLNSLPKTS